MENVFNQGESGAETTGGQELQAEQKRSWGRRIFYYVIGLFILALGVSVSVKADLGISPVSAIPYVLSLVTPLEMGITTIIVFTTYVLLQVVLLRKRFKIKNLLQIVCGVMFGSFVSVTNRLMLFDTPSFYPLRLVMLFVSIVLIAVGLMFFLAADIMPQPPEGLMLAIEELTGFPFAKLKIAFDCTVVLIAAAIGLICTHSLIGVREGTVISAVLVGSVLSILKKRFGAGVQAFLVKKEAPKNA
ncbi:DUF6198 family protein [Christensenellaceae bacterium OttesenSCG-928-M15]|nr:DUF6198 family protein [Christensenellaceae bacterium OttesenSCG-928-M15]